jgi:hypothetical protein
MSSMGGQRTRHSWVAIVAAYLLVLQAVFAGLAAGSYANAFSLDRTLALTHCAPGGEPPAGGDHQKSQNHAGMSCCTAGCPMAVGGDPAQPTVKLVLRRSVDQIAFLRRLDRPVGYLADRSPGNPRAPPALA